MYNLLENLCRIPSPSGEEHVLKSFIKSYTLKQSRLWKQQPEIIEGDDFQDCIMLKFGNPKMAAIAHMDTTGFTVRYENQLVPIGSPDIQKADILVGEDDLGLIECGLKIDEDHRVYYDFPRGIQTGTTLTYKPDFSEDKEFIISPYLDNRAGVFNLLKLAEVLENGLLVFSAWEEHGGGSVAYLAKYFYERFGINKALISDITWVSDGVQFGKGVAISIRDRNIPRRSFINKIIHIAQEHSIDFQLEVEGSGSSDGRELQVSPYPIDWCFVGAPESDAHSSKEKINKHDLLTMNQLYRILF